MPIIGWGFALFCGAYILSPVDIMPEAFAGSARHYRRRRGAGGGPAGRVVSHQGRESQPATIAVLTSAYPAWRLPAFPFFCGGVA